MYIQHPAPFKHPTTAYILEYNMIKKEKNKYFYRSFLFAAHKEQPNITYVCNKCNVQCEESARKIILTVFSSRDFFSLIASAPDGTNEIHNFFNALLFSLWNIIPFLLVMSVCVAVKKLLF
jgi:hypothetical protein